MRWWMQLLGDGPLMIEARAGQDLSDRLERLEVNAGKHVDYQTLASKYARAEHRFAIDEDGVATIELAGPILRSAEPILDILDIDYTVADQFRAAIDQLAADRRAEAIVIDANTPGGTVTGLQAVYEAVRAAAAAKPVRVAVSGMLASAGLYIAASASEIVAEPAAMIGSIGTVMVLRDYSQMATKMGLRTIVVSTGPHKGAGTPGTPITDEQLAPLQRIADQLGAQFQAVLVEGRGLDAEHVAALATGEVWTAADALAHGLVDRIATTPRTAARTASAAPAADAVAPTTPAAPAANHQTPTKDQPMAITVAFLSSLLATHPAHAELIAAESQKDDATEDSIKAAITAADAQATDAQLAQLTARVAEQATQLTAKDEKITALQAKVDQAKNWSANGAGTPDPGSNQDADDAAGDTTSDTALKARWGAMTKAEQAGYLGDFENYAEAVREGHVKA
jgi:signal peptide peptidase SppA